MRRIALGVLASMILIAAQSGAQQTSPSEILLWPEGAPGAKGSAPEDKPGITPFLLPDDSTSHAAVLVCPGGGYHMLMTEKEGSDYARWLNGLGVNAFVLKYRLGKHGYRHPAMLQDAARAMRLIRSNAATWHVDPSRVGIMGSSAGGHLASTVMTHFDNGDRESTDIVERQSSRPDLGILCYPVISFGSRGHKGSMENLLGKNPPEELRHLLSNELQVTTATPPAFLVHTANDNIVPVENSLLFGSALAECGVPFSLHIYPKGPHGIALGPPEARHPWTIECARWLREQRFAR